MEFTRDESQQNNQAGNLERREDYGKLLSDVGFIRGVLPGLQSAMTGMQSSIDKLFSKFDATIQRMEKMNGDFERCRDNGNRESEKADTKFQEISKVIEDNYNDLMLKMSVVSPEATKKKALADLEYKDRMWSIKIKWAKFGFFILLMFAVFIGTGVLVLRENGFIRITKEGKVIPSVVPDTNRGVRND